MFFISWKYDMVVYDECIAFLILGNIGWCIYLTEIFAELYRWWQRMIENDFPKLVNRIQKSSELILRGGESICQPGPIVRRWVHTFHTIFSHQQHFCNDDLNQCIYLTKKHCDWDEKKLSQKYCDQELIGISSLRQAPVIKRTPTISYQGGNLCPHQMGNQTNISQTRNKYQTNIQHKWNKDNVCFK